MLTMIAQSPKIAFITFACIIWLTGSMSTSLARASGLNSPTLYLTMVSTITRETPTFIYISAFSTI